MSSRLIFLGALLSALNGLACDGAGRQGRASSFGGGPGTARADSGAASDGSTNGDGAHLADGARGDGPEFDAATGGDSDGGTSDGGARLDSGALDGGGRTDSGSDRDAASAMDATGPVDAAAATGLAAYCGGRYFECGGSFYADGDACIAASTNFWGSCAARMTLLDAFSDCLSTIPCADYDPDAYNPANTPCASQWSALRSSPGC